MNTNNANAEQQNERRKESDMRKIVTFVREHWDSIILCCCAAALIAVTVYFAVMSRSNSQSKPETGTPPSCTCVIINISNMTEACTVEKNDGSTATYITQYGIACVLATNETHQQKQNRIYHPIAPPRYGVHSVV